MSTLIEVLDPDAFKNIFNSSVEGIVIVDVKGEILLTNPACEKLFGYDEMLSGKMIEELIPLKLREQHKDHRKKYNKNPKSRNMGEGIDLMGLKCDGTEFPVEVSLSHVKYKGKLIIVGFIIDITERKKAEEALHKSEEQLIIYATELERKVNERTDELKKMVEKLESEIVVRKQIEQEVKKALEREKELNELKSRFVSMASHEFRTPLSTILSSATLMSKYTDADQEDKRNKHFERIKSNVKELTGILNDFLSLGKLEEGRITSNPEKFEINQFVSDVIGEIKLIQGKSQNIKLIRLDDNLEVILDRQFSKNILLNLLSNAIKYSPTGKQIEVKINIQDKQLRIDIKDDGMGIPAKDQKHLFNRFFRAHNVTNIPGTGLGLNLVQKYVEIMNGNISFVSEEGNGSTFTVILPVTLDQNEKSTNN